MSGNKESSVFDIPAEHRTFLLKKYNSRPKSSGRTQMLRYLNGEKLTRRQAILAECFSCNGGIRDCITFTCPLFEVSTYRDKEFEMDAERIERKERMIKDYEIKVASSSGKSQYLRYLKGKKLTYKQAVIAKCADCNGGYADGRTNCGNIECTLSPFMPYRRRT